MPIRENTITINVLAGGLGARSSSRFALCCVMSGFPQVEVTVLRRIFLSEIGATVYSKACRAAYE